jgi:hypothetical protein
MAQGIMQAEHRDCQEHYFSKVLGTIVVGSANELRVGKMWDQ